MDTTSATIPNQVRAALDGRTQRWLSFEIRMPETDLSKKLNGELDFTQEELDKINERLKSNIQLTKVDA
jgi:hypothetical protein